MNEETNNMLFNQNQASINPITNSENSQVTIGSKDISNNNQNVSVTLSKPPIIVNGIDVSNISAYELDEDLIDEMTEEQADLYLEGKSEEEKAAFNEKNGFSVSMVLSEEELAKRQAERAGLSINVGKPQTSKPEPSKEPTVIKTEQTGSIIFGVKK